MSVSRDKKYRDPTTWINNPRWSKDIIIDIFRTTGEVYPGQWEMQAYLDSGNFYPMPVIHFPKITVKNRTGKSIDIWDMYVNFYIKRIGSGYSIPSLKGNRCTFDVAQFTSGYLHSHLSSATLRNRGTNVLKYGTFCLGSEGIDRVMNQMLDRWDVNVYRLFLLNIQTFLEYESLEGGPYMKMEKVFTRNQTSNMNVSMITGIQQVLDKLYAQITALDFNIKLYKGRLIVEDDEVLDNFLLRKSDTQYRVLIDEKGFPHPITSRMEVGDVNIVTDIFFLGENKNVKVIQEEDSTESVKKYVHPLIKTAFVKFLEYKLNNQKINEYCSSIEG